MLAAIHSAAVLGVDAYDVTVEVDCALGLPLFTVVGLPAGAVKESRERVGAALVNSGYALPPRRITVNLAPADIRKDGTAFDLPIALGLLVATGQLEPAMVEARCFVGELGLDGALRPMRGALPIARRLADCHASITFVLPAANVAEAALVRRLTLAAPATLRELVGWLRRGTLPIATAPAAPSSLPDESADFAEVVGQESAKRALEVAAAGGHNVLMVGPPGAGKTMLARRLPTILPALSEEEALEVTTIHSVAGTLPAGALLPGRPFRAPHHSISTAGLIGGGSLPRPGEVSLAHRGVLFLDELLEFPRHVLDGLRQPLEDGKVVISRAASTLAFPARFTLVGAMNPCPCGKAGETSGAACTCAPNDVARYRARLSGPLIDRIDMHVTVGAAPLRALADGRMGERSSLVRERVEAARSRQAARFRALRGIRANAAAAGGWIDRHTPVEPDAREMLASAAERLGLSARGYHRVLKVARTIADIDGDERLRSMHVAEALRYRPAVSGSGAGAARTERGRTG